MIKVTILFFATLRDIAGERRISKTIPNDMQISGLKEMLVNEFPALKEIMASVIVSLDHEFASENSSIPSGAEIALFPPVSGG
jgi:molybdopterin converting factor subunit 1